MILLFTSAHIIAGVSIMGSNGDVALSMVPANKFIKQSFAVQGLEFSVVAVKVCAATTVLFYRKR